MYSKFIDTTAPGKCDLCADICVFTRYVETIAYVCTMA